MSDHIPSKPLVALAMSARSMLRQAKCPECHYNGTQGGAGKCHWCLERAALMDALLSQPTPDETSARTCKYTQADDDTLLYLTDCGREFWRKGTHDLYDFCHFCGGAVEEATAKKANACQCDPNPSIGGSSPCPVHDEESEDAV